ncbi:DUF2164 domain-containing protein [Methanocella sp. MCL-LM]|uniref:DUF2164 domain-containing protein n=1 Tax=Methanocella sp. MCL-LM TaxID=3412035 RepID=UPI003C7570D7
MRKDTGIKISKEKRAEMVTAIKNYYLTERDEDIGDLAAGLILDFFIEKLAPEFYNQGVNDSYLYMEKMLEDLLSIQK